MHSEEVNSTLFTLAALALPLKQVHYRYCSFQCVFAADKIVTEVLDNNVNLWEEGRVEDELSPEEIQMVCLIYMTIFIIHVIQYIQI